MSTGCRMLILVTMLVVVSFHGSDGWWFFNKVHDLVSGIFKSKYHRDCYEVKNRVKNIADGAQYVRIKGEKTRVEVYCDMKTDGGGWTVIQRRKDGKVNFDRTWKDYKEGFGKVTEDFWIGNDKLYKLTGGSGRRQELRIDLRDWRGEKRWAKYDDFKVGSEETGYKLDSVGKYSGNAGDELTQLVGKSFSTKDKNSGQCAKKMKSAWWFSVCRSSYLNGEYRKKGGDTQKPGGVVWKKWADESLKFAQMMIREYHK